ncbi:flavin-containing monooxygenase [Albimonas pacifica]|uniref:Putative flavoprotein involved in K+ transport n=1 Tax=Albimonas pacifica TaxID=1114924 RepID=A0A1I3C040_9RHOB|nr:NAD(P)/FAD-dependent oxidoreductase [Albimonas pacifica]SFH67813.1 putative flavoprotein involved in K+ transport [Albimonas pacifica]
MLDGPDGDPAALVETWLGRLERAARARDALAPLFHSESFWRDAAALGPGLRTLCGPQAIAGALAPALAAAGAGGFVLDPDAPPPARVQRVDRTCLEAFLRFETRPGRARAVLRLVAPAPGEPPRAWTLLTALHELKGHEERLGPRRPAGQAESRDFRGPNWLDRRRAAQAFEDRDPAVLVVGAGQAGLAIAARLTALGVDTLVVDRHARVGDTWRRRYHALTLHNQVQVNHLPYLPFPDTWPTYIAKDKLAGWLESYAEAMEINAWTGTEFLGAERAPSGAWQVRLRREGGAERTLSPRHVILATGVSGIPNRPEIPGLGSFRGRVLHSSDYRDGEDFSGRRALVIGTGNSGHDIAQDLWSSGAQATLVQRSPTSVVNIEPSAQLPYAFYSDGPSTEICDLIAVSMPVPLLRRAHRGYTARAQEMDAALLDGLRAKGFRLDFGEDGTGWQFKYLARGGGYYFNVGCSDLIAEGEIGLVQASDLAGFEADAAILADGRRLPLDLVVLATGYKGQEALVARLFGEAVAARVGPVWGFGDGLELRNMFVPTPEPGLWFIAGSLAQCRIYSRYLALQIKAQEEGIALPG